MNTIDPEKLRVIPRYERGHDYVEFRPVVNVPGFTHRVIVNGRAVAWLSDKHKPSKRAAAFFLSPTNTKEP